MDEAAPLEDDAHAAVLTGDHTYVPLSARVPKQVTATLDAASATPIAPAPSDKDVLVVSALADKPKKRRRPVASAAAGDDDSTKAPPGSAASPSKKKKCGKAKQGNDERPAPLAPHDYSTSKSLLDAEPQAGLGVDDAGGKKKKRKDQVGRAAKGFKIDTSEFRREPRVNNAPKKGAISQSFTK